MIDYRYSTIKDKQQIEELLAIGFGDDDNKTWVNNLDNRYLLAVDDNKVIGLTGIIDENKYRRKEIDWTVVHPDYRRMEIMKNLFSILLKNIKEDIYCACWHKLNDKIHLHNIMDTFGFELVLLAQKRWNAYHSECTLCPLKPGDFCECQQDLYLRKIE